VQLDNFIEGRGVIRKDPATGLVPPPDDREKAQWALIDANIAARQNQYYGQAFHGMHDEAGDGDDDGAYYHE
jgi:hypothetical protein